MERYYKIGELAKLYDIGTDTIRYYEELGLIHPQRAENGYRIYSIKDIWRMNVIRDLRGLGFSMEQIGEYMKNRSVATTLEMMDTELRAIDKRIARLTRLRGSVQTRMRAIRAARDSRLEVVEKVRFGQRRCFEIREGFTTDEEMDVLTKRLLNRVPARLYIIGNTQIGNTINWAAVQKGVYNKCDSVLMIDREGDTEIPGGAWLRLRYRGSSKRNAEFIPVMLEHAEQHGLTPSGQLMEMVLIDIHEASDYGEHMTELQVRVEE